MNCDKWPGVFSALRPADRDSATELEQDPPFEAFVAVILSTQAIDMWINTTTPRPYAVANRPEKLPATVVNVLERYTRTIGLFDGKVHKPPFGEYSIESGCEHGRKVSQ